MGQYILEVMAISSSKASACQEIRKRWDIIGCTYVNETQLTDAKIDFFYKHTNETNFIYDSTDFVLDGPSLGHCEVLWVGN